MNNTEYSNIKAENKGSSKICIIHILVYLTIFILFLINFFLTIDNFKENKFIQMSPQLICKSMIVEHNECLNKYRSQTNSEEIIEECVGSNLRLQMCYDKVQSYNSKCFLYFSEFEVCINQNLKQNKKLDYLRNKCKSESEDINTCTSDFVLFDPFLLIESKEIETNL